MSDHARELARRDSAARQAIDAGCEMEDEESGIAMFVAFHLEELDAGYWQRHLGTPRPAPDAVLGILELRGHWGGDREMEFFDYTLPGEATDFVISVHFDEAGAVAEISMEN